MNKYSNIVNYEFDESKILLEEMRTVAIEYGVTFAKIISRSLLNKGKLIWCGNGGSAADSQHLSAEFVGRFKADREPLASIALPSDVSLLTCVSNDYSFKDVFSRQIEAFGKNGDVLICMSTSGNSPNVIKAIEVAKKLGLEIICLLGKKGGKAAELVENKIIVKSESTARVQEMHLLIGHIIVGLVEKMMGHE